MTDHPGKAKMAETPLGAIENGREHFRRLAEYYDFSCASSGRLENCIDYSEAVRCFECLVDHITTLEAEADPEALPIAYTLGSEAAKGRTIEMEAENAELRRVLQQHHDWHQQDGLEMKLDDEFFDCASCYADSSLEEQTSAILQKSGWRAALQETSDDD